jgi:hypothetical protein
VAELRRSDACFPTAVARARTQVGSCEVCGRVALGKILCEYFGFPCRSLYRLLHNNRVSSGAGTVCQIVAGGPSGLSLTPPKESKKK